MVWSDGLLACRYGSNHLSQFRTTCVVLRILLAPRSLLFCILFSAMASVERAVENAAVAVLSCVCHLTNVSAFARYEVALANEISGAMRPRDDPVFYKVVAQVWLFIVLDFRLHACLSQALAHNGFCTLDDLIGASRSEMEAPPDTVVNPGQWACITQLIALKEKGQAQPNTPVAFGGGIRKSVV